MRLLVAILAAVTLAGSVEAWATDEDAFISVFKKFGITTPGVPSKKPCLCNGGTYGGYAGRVVIFPNGLRYDFDCIVAAFNPDGSAAGDSYCLAAGGSMTVIDK